MLIETKVIKGKNSSLCASLVTSLHLDIEYFGKDIVLVTESAVYRCSAEELLEDFRYPDKYYWDFCLY